MASRLSVAADVVLMLKSGNWSDARPAHIVELYAWCHGTVYGVRPIELDTPGERGRKERMAAIGAARTLVDREFGGRVVECVTFLKWVWAREESREKWAKDNGKERGRLAWRALFCGRGILGDYLKACATSAARRA